MSVGYLGELRDLTGSAPDESFITLRVRLKGSGALLGNAEITEVRIEELKYVGFIDCTLEAELDLTDLIISEALAEVPDWALSHVAKTGKPLTYSDIYEGFGADC